MAWEAGCRYGIISTVPYEQQKINRQIILFQIIYYLSISLTGLPCHREPSIVLMSMVKDYTISQDVQNRFPVQLAFAKFLSKIKENS